MKEQTRRKEVLRYISLINVVVGAVNTVAGKALYDAAERFKKTKYYHGGVKHYVNMACESHLGYEMRHARRFHEKGSFFLDYLDCVNDEVQPHVDIMRLSIKSVLDRHHEPDSDLKSYMETARTMLEYACCVYDYMIEKIKESVGVDFTKLNTGNVRLTKSFQMMGRAMRKLYQKDGSCNEINLNEDQNCSMAFKILESKLTSEDVLNKAGYFAIKMNQEVEEEMSGADMKELEERYGNINNKKH